MKIENCDTASLCALIEKHETWLTTHTIEIAKERGYASYTSTLEEAWRAAICGISAPLISALADAGAICESAPAADFARDPVANYGVEVAERHRLRGISLGLFLGLMKGYRQTYLDLVDRGLFSPAMTAEFKRLISNYFDRMEVGICNEWASKPASVQLEELAAKNRAIINEKNKYLTIFESLRDPVFLVGDDGVVENMNNAAARLFLGHTTPGATYYGGERIKLRDLLKTPDGDQGDLLAGEHRLHTSEGLRCFDVKTQQMLDVSEKYLGTVFILADITDYRRATEQAQAADLAKSAFLATMSHEIRTPIHGIIGAAELMIDDDLPPRVRDYAEAITRSGVMLAAVVNDILDYSKIEAGYFRVEHEAFRIAGVVEDVFMVVRQRSLLKPGLQLQFNCPDLPTVLGDAGKLRQILLNLLDNAVKFTDEGSVLLTIAQSEIKNGNTVLTFQVKDTGRGIAAAERWSIFEPFTQLHDQRSRKFEGTGLGLAICRRLVEGLGGTIGVESEVGVGSVFTVTLPLAVANDEMPFTTQDIMLESHAPVRKLSILVVEDDEVNAIVALGLLERLGHRAQLASTGAEALKRVATESFDVALIDLHLPDMGGVELTRRIRAMPNSASPALPVAGLSAHATVEEAAVCREAGMQDLLFKPFRSGQLAALLQRVTGVGSLPSPLAAPPHQTHASALLDERVLSNHTAELGAEHARKIVQAFQQSASGLEHNLEQLLAAGDRPGIASIAHRLVSSSQHVGLVQLSGLAAQVERTVRQGDGNIGPGVQNLILSLRKSLVALDFAGASLGMDQPVKI